MTSRDNPRSTHRAQTSVPDPSLVDRFFVAELRLEVEAEAVGDGAEVEDLYLRASPGSSKIPAGFQEPSRILRIASVRSRPTRARREGEAHRRWQGELYPTNPEPVLGRSCVQ